MKMVPTEFWTVLGGVVGIIGVPLAIYSLWVSQKSINRQFGNDKAEILFVHTRYSDLRILQSLAKPSIFGTQMIGFDKLDDIIRLNPAVEIAIPDNRPIESIRLEVTPTGSFIDATKDFNESDRGKTPWVLEGVTAREYPLIQPPAKGSNIVISIADLIVKHMAQSQVKEPARRHRAHYGTFIVRGYAKLAGSPTWTAESAGKGLTFQFLWYPDGFPEADCDAFTGKFSQPLMYRQANLQEDAD